MFSLNNWTCWIETDGELNRSLSNGVESQFSSDTAQQMKSKKPRTSKSKLSEIHKLMPIALRSLSG